MGGWQNIHYLLKTRPCIWQKGKDWKRRLAKYQDSGIIKTDGWSDDAIERRRLDEASIAGHKMNMGYCTIPKETVS